MNTLLLLHTMYLTLFTISLYTVACYLYQWSLLTLMIKSLCLVIGFILVMYVNELYSESLKAFTNPVSDILKLYSRTIVGLLGLNTILIIVQKHREL